jgi:hypothetical protein
MEIKRFSVRTRPNSDESLSSYLLRLSKANGLSLLFLLNSFKISRSRGHYVQQSDLGLLDFAPNSIIDIDQLSERVNLPKEQLLQLSFYYALRTFCEDNPVERSRFISGMIRDRIYYCSDCLDKKPYFRLIWKIKDIEFCTFHGTQLIDKCCHCGSKINLSYEINLNRCTQCGNKLSSSRIDKEITKSEFDFQIWLLQSWNTLLRPKLNFIDSSNVAMRILYILNSKQSIIQEENLDENRIPNLATLLQHARNSLSHKRTLHLSILLKTLYEKQMTMDEFLTMNLPQKFIDSIRQKGVSRHEQYFCVAPWCQNYRVKGSLTKTGTSFKRLTSGETHYYYLVCKKCGCEYALNSDEELIERTYFIESYNCLKDLILIEKSIRRLAALTGYSEDKIKRCLAYFNTRNIFIREDKTLNLDRDLITLFVNALHRGQTIKEIQKWDKWEDYNHFLIHRFHLDVILAKLEFKRTRSSSNESALFRERVHQVLIEMLQYDIDITIDTVSKKIGFSPETLRNWGCNTMIAKIKKQQKMKRLSWVIEKIYEDVQEYLTQNSKQRVLSHQLYSYIGIQRTVLWRIAPKVTVYISEHLKHHNKQLGI